VNAIEIDGDVIRRIATYVTKAIKLININMSLQNIRLCDINLIVAKTISAIDSKSRNIAPAEKGNISNNHELIYGVHTVTIINSDIK